MSSLIAIDHAYRVELWDRLRTFRPELLLGAVEESRSFAPPNADGAAQNDIAQTIHDIALHLESLQDWELCKTLYRRVLEYPVNLPDIHGDARFRLAVCDERQGAYNTAIEAFREAIAHEAGTKVALRAHARVRMARLLMDAERFGEALALLEQVVPMLPVDQLAAHELWKDVGRCALRLGRGPHAVDTLRRAADAVHGQEGEVEVLRLLAEAYERNQQRTEAVECYRRIVSSGFSEPRTKAAATVRLQSLGVAYFE
ncbi:MAG: tetratricopeptide repeat protein [Bryobacterales bacterium]|nr:tetratricopeptide repeat protein [Bryobacterales bacterium]